MGQQNTASPEEGSLEASGFRLRYRIEGSGIPTLVIGSATYYPRFFKRLLAANRERLSNEALASLSFGEGFVKTYVRDAPRIWFDRSYDSTPLWAGVEINEVVQRIWFDVFPGIDVTKGLDTFDRPVLLALGRYDYLIAPPSAWDPLRGKFKDLTVRVFERSGHTPQFEEPALFDAELVGWLGGRRDQLSEADRQPRE